MDGQTDRHCSCCREEEEDELKHHGHPDAESRPQPSSAATAGLPLGPSRSISHWFLGSVCCICTLCEASLVFLMDKVILSVSGMAQTSSPSSSLCYSQGSHGWFALSLQGFIPGFWEMSGWKGRGSRRTLPRLPAPAQMCCSLQLMQQDNYVLPCRKSPCSVIWGQYHSSVDLAIGREP